MPVVSCQEMRAIEKLALEQYGLKEELIIENVGHEVAGLLYQEKLKNSSYHEIVFLIGRGNNGADGLSVARHLTLCGVVSRAFLLFPLADCSEDLKRSLSMARAYGVKVSEIKMMEQLEAYFNETQQNFFVVDAIFGTGVRFPLAPYLCDVINLANRYATELISLDIPSGIHGDTGASDSSNFIQASLTLAIGLPKMGHFLSDGAKAKGKLEVIKAGLPKELLEKGERFLLDRSLVSKMIKGRSKFAHKNVFGHVLVIGGSRGLTGAPILSAMAALKSGTGLVTIATWAQSYAELAGRVPPEIMLKQIPDEDFLLEDFWKFISGKFDAMVIGPGLGQENKTRDFVRKAIQTFNGPMVIDADAINVLTFASDGELIAKKGKNIVFTPHVGEFSRFIKEDKLSIMEQPLHHVKRVVEELNCNLLLKGPCTYVMPISGEIFFNDYPNDGMAKGGTGDVLAGIIGGLLAQTFVHRHNTDYNEERKIKEAMCMGVTLHTLAGMVAAKEHGVYAMTAGTLIESLSKVFLDL